MSKKTQHVKKTPVRFEVELIASPEIYGGLMYREVNPYTFTDRIEILDFSLDLASDWFDFLWAFQKAAKYPIHLLYRKNFAETLKFPSIVNKWRVRYWYNLNRWMQRSDKESTGIELMVPKDWEPKQWASWARQESDKIKALTL